MNEDKDVSIDKGFKIRLDDDYSDEIEYPDSMTFNDKRKFEYFMERFGIEGFSKTEVALIVLAGFLVLLVIFFLVFLPGKSEKEDERKISRMESRLTAIEEKLGRLDLIEQQLAMVAEQSAEKSKDVEIFMERSDRQEAAIAGQLNQLNQEINDLKKRNISADKTPSGAKQVPPAATQQKKTKTPATSKEKVHTVSKGETLYSISRRYGVSVKALKELNRLSEKLLIYPGQKLKIP